MDAKQFAWLYLIEHGEPGKPSYYGGVDIDPALVERFPQVKNEGWFERPSALERALKQEILDQGVDWDKTLAPESDRVAQFTDTFHDPEYKEFILGTLVLKNGYRRDWCAESIEVTNVFEMMARASECAAKFKEIFG